MGLITDTGQSGDHRTDRRVKGWVRNGWAEEWVDGWMGGFENVDNVFLRLGGFAKVDNGFGLI